jgi:uncharacterized membrane protein YphA (DoxX/SURF4 family)
MNTSSDTFLVMILFARLAIGSFLLPSSVGKIRDLPRFTAGVRAYRILPDRVVPVFSWVLPWIELALALLLVLGIYVPLTALAVSILVSCFTIAVVVNLVRGRTIACHCHGLAGNRTITWGTVARNLPLIGLSLWLSFAAPTAITWTSRLQLWNVDLGFGDSRAALLLLGCLIGFWWATLALIEWVIVVQIQTTRLYKGQV